MEYARQLGRQRTRKNRPLVSLERTTQSVLWQYYVAAKKELSFSEVITWDGYQSLGWEFEWSMRGNWGGSAHEKIDPSLVLREPPNRYYGSIM